MWDNEKGGAFTDESARRVRNPSMNPLDKALHQLAVKEREEIAKIVRREIERPKPEKSHSD